MMTTDQFFGLLLLLLLLILGIGMGVFSLYLAFTPNRSRRITLIVSILSSAIGLVLAFETGFSFAAIWHEMIMGAIVWSPLIMGSLSFWRWRTSKSKLTSWEISGVAFIVLSYLFTLGSFIKAREAASDLLVSVGYRPNDPFHWFQVFHHGKLSPRWIFSYSSGGETGGEFARVHVSLLGEIKYRMGHRLSGSNIQGVDN